MKRKKALISEDVTLWQHDDTSGVVIPDIRIKAASSGDRFGLRCFFSQTQRTVPCVQAFNARKFFVLSEITREILHNSISSAVKGEARNVKSDSRFASLPCRRVIFPFRTIYPHI